ncbi:Spy/CpxP family protein refolding chaperone [Ochrobactrum sp. MYb379]|uniref:Spy/CpxP family protein refolding chaperone n=1 Tax=Ochrobactrum sp. MYb379 TaxID=2745275 RepID=UPI0030AA20EB
MTMRSLTSLTLSTSVALFSLPTFAQDKPAETARQQAPEIVEIYTADDAAAVLDARIIALKTVLALNDDQLKNWDTVEKAIRDIAAKAAERKHERSKATPPGNIADILERTADAEITRGEELKKLTAAMKPLVESLTFEQQMRIPSFLGMKESSNGLAQPTSELWIFEEEQ